MGDKNKAYVITLGSVPFAICENEDALRAVAAETVKRFRGVLSSPLTIEITHGDMGISVLTCKTGLATHTFFAYNVPKF